MILKSGPAGKLPPEFAARAVVILDSGISTDYSVFLDLWRKWIRVSIASKCHMDTSVLRPRVYILHAEEDHACRYGVGHLVGTNVPDNYYQHEVRPRKRNPKTIHRSTRKRGLAWSFVRMELNSHKNGMVAPWRFSKYGDDQPKHDRRPIGVMLEPDQKDLKFLSEHEKLWKRFDRMPRLWLGAGAIGQLPHTFMRWLDGVLALTPQGHRAAFDAFAGVETLAYGLPTARLLTKGEPKYDYGIADNWDCGGRRVRNPAVADFILSKLPPGTRFLPSNDKHGGEVAEAINCRHYLVFSVQESMAPYDGLLALAGGAKVYAPDLPAWRSVKSVKPSHVALYPVRSQGNNRCVWNPLDVATFLKAHIG